MIIKYTSRYPVEAIQFTGNNAEEIKKFIDFHFISPPKTESFMFDGNGRITVKSYDSTANINKDDYVVKDRCGDIKIYGPGLFQDLFDEVTEQ